MKVETKWHDVSGTLFDIPSNHSKGEPLKPREFNIEVVATYVYDIFTAIFHFPPPISSLTTPERICISSTQVNAFELEKPQVNAFACRIPITLQFHPRASNMSGQVCLLMLPPLSLRPFWVLSSSWLRIHTVYCSIGVSVNSRKLAGL